MFNGYTHLKIQLSFTKTLAMFTHGCNMILVVKRSVILRWISIVGFLSLLSCVWSISRTNVPPTALIWHTLLHETHHVSDQNNPARMEAQLCQLYWVAQEHWHQDGLSHIQYYFIHCFSCLARTPSKVISECPSHGSKNTLLWIEKSDMCHNYTTSCHLLVQR